MQSFLSAGGIGHTQMGFSPNVMRNLYLHIILQLQQMKSGNTHLPRYATRIASLYLPELEDDVE
eukprot:2833311-Pyramimonas_sp.AAC.1